MANQPDIQYSDFGLDFTPSPDTGNISVKTNANAIKQSLSNLMLLAFGEKPFHPEIGFGLRNYLFENMTPIVISTMRRHIEEIITSYEPRVKILGIDFRDTDNNINITIMFKAINIENPIKLDFLVQRIR